MHFSISSLPSARQYDACASTESSFAVSIFPLPPPHFHHVFSTFFTIFFWFFYFSARFPFARSFPFSLPGSLKSVCLFCWRQRKWEQERETDREGGGREKLSRGSFSTFFNSLVRISFLTHFYSPSLTSPSPRVFLSVFLSFSKRFLGTCFWCVCVRAFLLFFFSVVTPGLPNSSPPPPPLQPVERFTEKRTTTSTTPEKSEAVQFLECTCCCWWHAYGVRGFCVRNKFFVWKKKFLEIFHFIS